MKTDTEIRVQGVAALEKSLGAVEAERFIALIQRESFDYTKWRGDLFEEMSLEEMSHHASERRRREESAR